MGSYYHLTLVQTIYIKASGTANHSEWNPRQILYAWGCLKAVFLCLRSVSSVVMVFQPRNHRTRREHRAEHRQKPKHTDRILLSGHPQKLLVHLFRRVRIILNCDLKSSFFLTQRRYHLRGWVVSWPATLAIYCQSWERCSCRAAA